MKQAQRTWTLTHFNLNTCKNILLNVGDHGFLKAITATLFCAYSYLFNDGSVLIPVFTLVIFDSITGVMKACKAKELSSQGFVRVAMKFTAYLIMIATAGVLDREFPGQYATTSMKSFLMVTEAISIMENIGALGWPVPLKLLEYLKVHHDASSNKLKNKGNNKK